MSNGEIKIGYDYYKEQLNKLNPIDTIHIKLSDDNTNTNSMVLNLESIEALETFLNAYKILLKK